MSVAGDEATSTSTASASPPSPLPNPPPDSMEAANRDHKRRRLNSESRDDQDTLVMSTDHPVPDSPSVPALTFESSEQQVEMTIRSQLPSSSNPQDHVPAAHDNNDDDDDLVATTTTDDTHLDLHVRPATGPTYLDQTMQSESGDADTNNAIVGGGDASADSPPVIAVPDDDDDEANDDHVELMVDCTSPIPHRYDYDAESYFQTFPFTQNGNYSAAVINIGAHLQSSASVDGTVLPQLTMWLDSFPDQPLDRKAFFTEKAEFWDNFASLISKLFARRSPFGDGFFDIHRSEESVFTTFFVAYIRICMLLFQADTEILSQWTDPEPCSLPIVSHRHIRMLFLVLRPEKPHVFHLLNKEYGVDIAELADQYLRAFYEFNGLRHLLDFADQACSKAPPVVVIHVAVSTAPILEHMGYSIATAPVLGHQIQRPQVFRDMLHFFRRYDEHLQIPGKIVDTNMAREAIINFSSLLLNLCLWDRSIANDLVDHMLMLDFRDPESPTSAASPPEYDRIDEDVYRSDPILRPVLVQVAWKFKLLRKYLVKGRMELRVMSIGSMDTALVDIWREYNNQAESGQHPVMQYLADFLLDQKVINYIISVDSHPQLISRSGNIVGFLVVTHRYSESESDAIWNTVSNSSDPRVVAATMTMLCNIIHLMQGSEIRYLLTKLFDLPIENCTLDIFRFQREIVAKYHSFDWTDADFKARPWNVSIRIMQDTSAIKDTSKLLMALHHEAAEQLRAMAYSINIEERYDIYHKCIAHIESRSSKATGSVHALHILTSSGSVEDVGFFTDCSGVTRHILEEMCAYIKNEEDGSALHTTQAYAMQYRLELLSFLIQRATTAIPSDLYQSIWDHLVGEYARKDQLRDMAWSKFLQAMKFAPDNAFCKSLISTYAPKLDPRYYTTGYFEFVAAYGFTTTREMVDTVNGKKELLQIRGAHLLWRMILSAPPRTIEDRTAHLLAARYLELDPIHAITLPDMEAAHTALVEQCVHEILSSYKILRGQSTSINDDMDVVVTDTLKQQNERRLTRTVLFLKLMLMSVRTKAEFNRSRRSDSKVEPLENEDLPDGDVVEVRYQQSGTNEKQSIIVGSNNTMQDVYKRLCYATGYSKINIFHFARRVEIEKDGSKTVAELDLGSQHLLVQKAQGSEVNHPASHANGNCSVFETTILNRFEELFACMDSEDLISATLYDFLICLPYQERIAKSVTAGTMSAADLLPPDKHYQAKYTVQTLLWKLEQQLKSTLEEKFLANSVRILDQALLNPSLIMEASSLSHLQLAGVIVCALLTFLKERPSTEVSSSYFSDGNVLVGRLVKLMSLSLDRHIAPNVALSSYAVIVEASLHSRSVWNAFLNNEKATALHKSLLLDDGQKGLREKIAKVISSVCGGALSPSSALTQSDTATCFWKMISPILPHAIERPNQSEQLFDLAEEVFRKYDEENRDEVALRLYLSTWSNVLLSYDHDEEVGQGEIDFVVFGFSRLLLCCISSLKSFKKPLNAGQLVERLWKKFLFVPRVFDIDESSTHRKIPVLESNTRKELLDLVLALAEDRPSYNKLLELSANLGIDESNMLMRSGFDVDREDAIRSPTGYLGLNNPRAICYMNSLLAQLFMNVNFRKFMLGLDVAEPAASQRLLHDTQVLFSMMQNSYRKWADPQDFAACVRVPDGGSIDINVQMDADEFYNLLFDQWEAQMLSPEVKNRFRSFYGGQTVNQIKSKECEHVSERLESFFVVQCDVQGKSNLHESLQSFVEGDVMEGENKYKCESCGGKLVDAVKRTCLKDIPDNLIFHLKRFDFDLVSLSRAKINDHFDFPMYIDVSPYKVDHLSDPSKPCEEDWFELVGVLVHQGSSEAGHYYSYIRTRPDSTEKMARWSEFNDRDVDAFDPQFIASRAFGGWDDKFQRQMKNYSAYMLFYQRRSAILEDRAEYMDSLQHGNAKVPIPSNLDRDISNDNDRCIREYCMFDPYHTKFLRQLLSNLRTINRGTCSEDHVQETQALHIMLEHLFQVHIRVRAPENFDEALLQLRKTAMSCSTCCLVVVRWFADNDSALLNMLILCETPKLRSQSRAFLIDCLRFLRDREPGAYGLECMDIENECGPVILPQGVLSTVVARLRMVADHSYLAIRSWDDFYLTLCQISEIGTIETAALLNHDFLGFCLHIFCMTSVPTLQNQLPALWRVTEKRKRVYNRMVEFVYLLLSKMDHRLPRVPDTPVGGTNRLDTFERSISRFALSEDESRWLFYWYEENRAYAALDRMLETFDVTKTEIFYPGEILKWMLQVSDPLVQKELHLTVHDGITQLKTPQSDPYVRAALPYCQNSTHLTSIGEITDAVFKTVGRSSKNGGDAHIHFFAGYLNIKNDAVFEIAGEDFFYRKSLSLARKVALSLLMYEDENVRISTAKHCRILFTEWTTDHDSNAEALKLKYRHARELAFELQRKITQEHRAGFSRAYMQPMIETCSTLVDMLCTLDNLDDPLTNHLKSATDLDLFSWQRELETLLGVWTLDEETPQSMTEAFDASDYGSESDVDAEAFEE